MISNPIRLTAVVLSSVPSLFAQTTTPPAVPFEPLPTLNAATILQPQYLQGPNFTVRNPVPTYSGANQFTIDSDYGVFTAGSNQMLLRRVAEINGIAKLQALSQTDQFAQAAAQAAATPLRVAQDLVTDPVETISSVPRGIFGFLHRAGETVEHMADGTASNGGDGSTLANMTGFSKTKRDYALRMGVDPYSKNAIFQTELNKVAWPAFLGKMTVDLGMAAVTGGAGTALSAANWTATLQASLREKSPGELQTMNRDLLTNSMGIANEAASDFLNNPAISPTTQTLIVAALGQLGNISGQGEFIVQAANVRTEHDALAFQLSVQIMAKLSETDPVVSISHLGGLTVCQTKDGTVVVPIQWDYLAWTPGVAQFITALKAEKLASPPTGYTVMINGVASPAATQALTGLDVNLVTKALPGPLQ